MVKFALEPDGDGKVDVKIEMRRASTTDE